MWAVLMCLASNCLSNQTMPFQDLKHTHTHIPFWTCLWKQVVLICSQPALFLILVPSSHSILPVVFYNGNMAKGLPGIKLSLQSHTRVDFLFVDSNLSFPSSKRCKSVSNRATWVCMHTCLHACVCMRVFRKVPDYNYMSQCVIATLFSPNST